MRVRFNRFPSGRTFIGIITAAVIFFSGCTENPTFLGRDILPTSDNINVKYDSTSLIKAWTVSSKPAVTINNSRLLVGSTRDDIFGYSRAQFMAPLVNAINKNLETGREIDSLILTLRVDTTSGDAVAQTMRVFEVTQEFSTDSLYYSDLDPAQFYNPVELGSAVYHPGTDTLIRIHITNQDYLNKFLTTNDTVFNDPEDFQKIFKGIFVNADPIVGNGGSITYVDFLDAKNNPDGVHFSGMWLYYKNDSTRAESDTIHLIYPMLFSNILARANFFTHDYTGSMAGQNLNNPDSNDSLLYISAMSGLNVQLDFSDINKWLDSTKVVINQAQLILPVENTIFLDTLAFPVKLVMWTMDESGNYNYLFDDVTDQGSSDAQGRTKVIFNGYYDGIMEHAYVFNIGRQLQGFINKETDLMNFVLLPTLNSQSTARTILKSPGSSGIRLRIFYTDI